MSVFPTAAGGTAGCPTLFADCHGVTVGVRVNKPTGADNRFDIASLDFSVEQQSVLDAAIDGIQTACTRDEDTRSVALTEFSRTASEATGADRTDHYMANGTGERPVRYDGDPSRLTMLFNNAE